MLFRKFTISSVLYLKVKHDIMIKALCVTPREFLSYVTIPPPIIVSDSQETYPECLPEAL